MKKQYSPKCPKVSHCPIPIDRDSGTGRDSKTGYGKIKEASDEQLFVTEI